MLCGCPHSELTHSFWLVKFIDDPYATDMWKKNYLYFNLLKNFRGKERSKDGRCDPREGIMRIERSNNISILKDGQVIASGGKGAIQFFMNDYQVKSCSLYRWEYDKRLHFLPIDERIKYKGTKALVIHNVSRFFDQFDKVHKAKAYKRHIVHYFDPDTHTGDLGLFCKDKCFSFEKEYRIIINSNYKGPLNIKIPDLKKYSMLLDVDQLIGSQVRLTPTG